VDKTLPFCKIQPFSPRFRLVSFMRRQSYFSQILTPLAGLGMVLCLMGAAMAQSTSNPSGLPLPRFASTRSAPINVRVGPGTRYDLAWTYVKAGQPVEIIQEFDTWRKIRDAEGEVGWIHQNLLSGRRIGQVMPWSSEQTGLRQKPSEDAPVRAWLGSGFLVVINACEDAWCTVEATPAAEGSKTYKGFVPQSRLWGVYPDETFD
jgi:SH3-like domain-containing protein